ncbi:MAG: MBL fold metallo-hydrolase [Deltaproteobacteria bacterium]|nr:MBL fold metallo-hydrolase [Deltaproteobacteria bacterium]
MLFRQLYDNESSTYTYLLADESTKEAILIDPVRELVDRDVQLIEELGLTLVYALDTHVHADHVTGAGLLREKTGCKTIVSAEAGAPCADMRLDDGATVEVGVIRLKAHHTPGHTSGDMTYVVTDAANPDAPPMAFTGDTLLIRGCGRTDFQQGDSRALFASVHEKLFTLPEDTRVYPAHDYKGRTMSTIAEEKEHNPRLGGGRTIDEFVAIMEKLNLSQPKKIHIAVPANLQCGNVQADVQPVRQDADWAPLTRTPEGIPEVEHAWVADHLDEVRLIDVREPDELEGELGSLYGVDNVPLGQLEDAMRDADEEQRGEPTVIVCRSGNRSGTAARMLEELGFTKVASMAGGMKAYRGRTAASCG